MQKLLGENSEIAGAWPIALTSSSSFISPPRQGPHAPQPTALHPLPPNTVLGEFRLVREIRRGGMGIVYEAEQVSLGRRVALKVLSESAALDPLQVERFRVETQAVAQLHHPHIVPIFAVGSGHGTHHYAMQFIDGTTLAELIERQRRGMSSCRNRGAYRALARLALQAAEALNHAHAMGILHRDIKPSNLLVDSRGNLWVTDFGLARFQDEPGLTRTGDLLGTLRYLAPELAMGHRVVHDPRSDVYSLGATLYELLSLRPSSTAAIARRCSGRSSTRNRWHPDGSIRRSRATSRPLS